MKERILDSLYHFSQEQIPKKSRALFDELATDLELTSSELGTRAKKTLKELLHNYAFFEVSTIDKFNHKLIRTFAQDLKLSQGFEVILDTGLLLEEAVNNLLSKTGADKELTRVLIDFSLDKIDEDKSWDIAYDLNDIGKLVFQENHYKHLIGLQTKDIKEFIALQSKLKTLQKMQGKQMQDNARSALALIYQNGLETSDFYAGYFPKFLAQIAEGDLAINFTAKWKQDFENTQLYKKNAPSKDKIIALHAQFIPLFEGIKNAFYKLDFLKNILNNLIPLAVLNEILKEIKAIQKEKDVIPISNFNTIIAQEIQNQPVPFIYERLGEKYRHYFIDEFQDTSLMQWQNLIPLVSNALESENEKGERGSLLLVGDVKQAIYRWRGGRAEQFLNLINLKSNPFSIPPIIKQLDTNWRSRNEIVNFNNGFFSHVATKLSSDTFQHLFEEGNKQIPNQVTGGYLELSFVETQDDKEADDPHCLKVLELLQRTLQKNYGLDDVCILVRENKNASLIADYLAQNKIPVISPDSLVLASNQKVNFLISFLTYLENQNDRNAKYEILYHISENKNSYDFIAQNIDSFEEYLFQIHGLVTHMLIKRPTYDIVELLISKFKLAEDADAYVTQFLDEVFKVEHSEGMGIGHFLQHWKVNGHKLSLTAPQNLKAVKVMTIHKAKGLEFPVVIFPFADSKIIDFKGEKIWAKVDQEEFCGFNEVLLNFNKKLDDYDPNIVRLYRDELKRLELDAYNVLYVAMTRAIDALFVVATNSKKTSGALDTATYSSLFKDYLTGLALWEETVSEYSFGAFTDSIKTIEVTSNSFDIPYIYSTKQLLESMVLSYSAPILKATQVEAIDFGELFHQTMALVKSRNDIEPAIERVKQQNEISLEHKEYLRSKITALVQHSSISGYFSDPDIQLNEIEIIDKNGNIIRPDKVILKGNKATLIDFKTGQRKKEHINQINQYARVLGSMGYEIEDQVIIYVDQDAIQPHFIQ